MSAIPSNLRSDEWIEDDDEELTIDEIKRMHDKAFNHNLVTREKAAEDIVFYWITNWDDKTFGDSSLGYKGEYNIIRKAGRQIIGDLRQNPVQINFEQKNTADNSGGDLLDGMYRTSTRENNSIESFDNAKMEKVVCGIGGWELYADYENNQLGNENQKIDRRPIHEFNSVAFPDPGAVKMDKSDANFYSVLVPYSEEGMEALAEELTGESEPGDTSTFKEPEQSYTFPWIQGRNEIYYAVRFYHRVKINDEVITLSDGMGDEKVVLRSSVSKILDELLDDGFEIINTKKVVRYKVRLYIVNGNRILKCSVIPGPNIPVVPDYGERAIVEGEEHYEGCTRLAKDPQRLHNFQISYLGDIVSRTPRPQPIFFADQIAGYEHMYQNAGADSYYPYLLQQRFDANNKELPIGPVAQMPEQPVSSALMQSIALSREAVGDVAPANVPQDVADIDLSGVALRSLQNRLDEQSIVYQQNHKHALRRDAEIYAGMASVINDTQKSVTVTKVDGTRSTKQLMENVFDIETGELVTINDLTNQEFDVYADIGPSYTSKKEETLVQLEKMIEKAVMVNPQLAEMLMLKQIEMVDGVNMDDVRKYAHKQALIKGYIEPDEDNEDDAKIIAEAAQQSQAPDANMVLANAEQAKADANMAEVQRKGQVDQVNAKTAMLKSSVSQFEAETKRMAVQVDAQEANANINFKRIDLLTKRTDAINNQQLRTRVNG